jgi:Holliday junction resolvase RusA-like endonuclease
MRRLEFRVAGKPEPAGSKRAFPIRRKGGAMGVAVTDDNARSKPWQARVALAADVAMDGAALFTGPLGLALEFDMRRPKGHFGTGRNAERLKTAAPERPITKPDCTKLVRGVEDAMTGVVWADDAQVVEQLVTKRYAGREGVRVVVWTV